MHDQELRALGSGSLLNLARERGEDFNYILVRYGHERLLARLATSEHRTEFVLKGAMLFSAWGSAPYRATRDLDLLGRGEPDPSRIAVIFREIVAGERQQDGAILFNPASIAATRIKEDAEYDGVRVTLEGKLGTAKVPVQVDIGFGDAITPGPVTIDFPMLLGSEPLAVRAYPRETVVAEKVHAMVNLGLLNSRTKDFFDVWFLSRTFAFDAEAVVTAFRATFARRRTPMPPELPLALTEAFATNPSKVAQWTAFTSRTRTADGAPLPEVVAACAAFVGPPLLAASSSSRWEHQWLPKGPWLSK